jgi:hypothetical protein
LSGCWRQENRKDLDFRFALPESWDVDRVERLDTDHDGDNEWVILYAFDNPGDKDFAPIRGAIYDIFRREPKLPIIYPYHLQAPGWTFLGEGMGNVTVRLDDVVTVAPEGTPRSDNEIIVEDIGPDDFIKRVSIYRWQDNVPTELRKRTDPHEILLVPGKPLGSGEWYECIGMFAGSQVLLKTDRVTVIERFNDRSQLAKISNYSAKAAYNGYVDPSDYQLAEPDSVCVNFARDAPGTLAESPYPEKIVVAYHNAFNKDPDFGATYLTKNAKNNRGSNSWSIFGPGTRDVCIKQISYGPPNETESEILSFGTANDQTTTDIEVREHPNTTPPPPEDPSLIQALVKTTGTYKIPGIDQPQKIQIEWTLVRDPKPAGQQEMWKIDSIHEPR